MHHVATPFAQMIQVRRKHASDKCLRQLQQRCLHLLAGQIFLAADLFINLFLVAHVVAQLFL